jgi:hypothetical protein
VVWVGLHRDGRAENMLAGWALVLILLTMFVTKLGFSWYLMAMIAMASLAGDWRVALVGMLLSCTSFFLNVWDSASNDIVQLPVLFPAPRFYLQLFVSMWVFGLAVLEIGRRARQRFAEYSIDQR